MVYHVFEPFWLCQLSNTCLCNSQDHQQSEKCLSLKGCCWSDLLFDLIRFVTLKTYAHILQTSYKYRNIHITYHSFQFSVTKSLSLILLLNCLLNCLVLRAIISQSCCLLFMITITMCHRSYSNYGPMLIDKCLF